MNIIIIHSKENNLVKKVDRKIIILNKWNIVHIGTISLHILMQSYYQVIKIVCKT